MSSPELRVTVTIPSGFTSASVAPPDLTQSPQLSLEQWDAARDANGNSLIWACVSAETSVWNADATELAQDKLAELASKYAAKTMHGVRASRDGRDRTLASDDAQATARTMLAFTADRAHACFVTCTAPPCAGAVENANVSGPTVDPPHPGLALGALSYAVHHPHQALAGFGGLVVLAATLAIATRPGKPKKTKRSHS